MKRRILLASLIGLFAVAALTPSLSARMMFQNIYLGIDYPATSDSIPQNEPIIVSGTLQWRVLHPANNQIYVQVTITSADGYWTQTVFAPVDMSKLSENEDGLFTLPYRISAEVPPTEDSYREGTAEVEATDKGQLTGVNYTYPKIYLARSLTRGCGRSCVARKSDGWPKSGLGPYRPVRVPNLRHPPS